jgi:hypothetical protein
MDITVRIKFDPESKRICAVADANTVLDKKRGVMVTTAKVNDRLIFTVDNPATEVVVFFTSGPKAGASSPVSDPAEPRVLQNVPSVVKGPKGRYRYSCVVNTLAGMKTWPALDGGGGEVDIPTGRSV